MWANYEQENKNECWFLKINTKQMLEAMGGLQKFNYEGGDVAKFNYEEEVKIVFSPFFLI